MNFKIGKYYKSSSKYLAIVGTATTTCHGHCLVGETTDGRLHPVGSDEIATTGYVEVSEEEWFNQFPAD